MGVQPYTTGNPACSTHGLSTSRRWPGLCDDGNGFPVPVPPPQPTYENVIPDSGYYDHSSYQDSYNKYNQYEVAKVNEYVAPTPRPQPVQQPIIRTQPAQPQYSGNKLTDYTFSGFGFNRQPQQQQQQQQIQVVTAAPVRRFNLATTPKPVQHQQTQTQTHQRQEIKQHSAFYTYNWDSLFKNYYSYNSGK